MSCSHSTRVASRQHTLSGARAHAAAASVAMGVAVAVAATVLVMMACAPSRAWASDVPPPAGIPAAPAPSGVPAHDQTPTDAAPGADDVKGQANKAWRSAVDQASEPDVRDVVSARVVAAVGGLLWFTLVLRRRLRGRRRARVS